MNISRHSSLPSVSVIIPCYNSKAGLRITLDSIAAQDYPREKWEVIVVDNNSGDHSLQAARAYTKTLPLLKVEKEVRPGSYAARNRGIRSSKGDILAFIDTDMTVARDWVRIGVGDLDRTKSDYLGCKVEILPQKGESSAWEIYDTIAGFPIKKYVETLGFAGAGCLFVKREVLDKVGPFDNRLMSGGDFEFGSRVKDAGFKQYYSAHNVMRHPARSTMKSFVQKTVRIARGSVDIKWYYPDRFGKLNFLSILSSYLKPVSIHKGFKSLDPRHRVLMVLISNFLNYIKISSQLLRCLQLKCGDNSHPGK